MDSINSTLIIVLPVTYGDSNWEIVKAIRYDVFVVEQKVDEQEEYDEYEEISFHFLALADGQPAGTARWRKTSKGYKLERFAVLENYRNTGIGSTLVQAVLGEVLPLAEANKELIYLHAQVQAIPFYDRHGFITFGEEFIEAEIRHLAMSYQWS